MIAETTVTALLRVATSVHKGLLVALIFKSGVHIQCEPSASDS